MERNWRNAEGRKIPSLRKRWNITLGRDRYGGCSCVGEVEVDISWKVKSKTKISVNGPATTENTKKKEQNSPKEYDK